MHPFCAMRRLEPDPLDLWSEMQTPYPASFVTSKSASGEWTLITDLLVMSQARYIRCATPLEQAPVWLRSGTLGYTDQCALPAALRGLFMLD